MHWHISYYLISYQQCLFWRAAILLCSKIHGLGVGDPPMLFSVCARLAVTAITTFFIFFLIGVLGHVFNQQAWGNNISWYKLP